MKADLLDRLLEPDWHDPACPFRNHCYCDDGAPHDAVRHPLAREAADEIASLRARVEAMTGAVKTFLARLDECTPYINDAFLHRELRCGEYTGPTYAAELENLRQALKDTPTRLTR